MTEDQADDFEGRFDELFGAAVDLLLDGASFETLQEWLAENVTLLAPELAAPFAADADALQALGLQIARLIWARTPDPELGFASRKLPKLERNLPCPCGSGRKYKNCCQHVPSMVDALPDLNLLHYVLDRYPRVQLKQLPMQRISGDDLAQVAEAWYQDNRIDDAVTLLEAYFKHSSKLDVRAEWPFELLMGFYLELDHPIKRKRLLARILDSTDKRLRAIGLQKQCTMLADSGEPEQAWALFRQAQRLDPDNYNLSHLEIVLLMSQNRQAEAADRARFWIHRLRRFNDPELQPMLDFLQRVAEDPNAAMLSVEGAPGAEMERLERVFSNLPEPVCMYRLDPKNGDAGALQANASAAALLGQWTAIVNDELDPSVDLTWLDWLENCPQALNLFEVIHDVYQIILELNLLDSISDDLRAKISNHGERLLREVLRHNQAETCRLQWLHLDNRAALSLIAFLISDLERDQTPRAIELMSWMVEELNPDDNLGFRGPLLHACIESGALEQALELAKRYHDDFAEMHYGKVLALFVGGNPGKALTALVDAYTHFPRVLDMLLQQKPKKPKLQAQGFTLGGADEAWFYREAYFDLWQRCGALEWARSVNIRKLVRTPQGK